MSIIALQKISRLGNLPTKKQFQLWIDMALPKAKQSSEIAIRIVDEREIIALNKKFRNKNKPTNILSFPFTPSPFCPDNFLGDLVICASVVKTEAKEQQKKIMAHWAHLTIHGTLHLLGFDHIKTKDAVTMENLEIKLLKKLGFPNPF